MNLKSLKKVKLNTLFKQSEMNIFQEKVKFFSIWERLLSFSLFVAFFFTFHWISLVQLELYYWEVNFFWVVLNGKKIDKCIKCILMKIFEKTANIYNNKTWKFHFNRVYSWKKIEPQKQAPPLKAFSYYKDIDNSWIVWY